MEPSSFLFELIAFHKLAPCFLLSLVKEAEGVLLSEEAEPWLHSILDTRGKTSSTGQRSALIGQRPVVIISVELVNCRNVRKLRVQGC